MKSPAVKPPLLASKVIPPSTVVRLLPLLSKMFRLAVSEIAPVVEEMPLSMIMVCAVTVRSLASITMLLVWKVTLSSASPVTAKLPAFKLSNPWTLIVSAPLPELVDTVTTDAVDTNVTAAPNVESMMDSPSLPVPESDNVTVSAAPIKSNTRLVTSKLSLSVSVEI
ncbi:hypothetical protein V144x_31420 [Gimesia aquarii]|uniref:Uncharacterized protein n=1 Tax=Gimesia aquarii TaxID=2527964 RepID=A0A517VXC9_9PLAN|nr:hypothetical protein V144x_31420 [Gimesia aquarii]